MVARLKDWLTSYMLMMGLPRVRALPEAGGIV